MQSKHKLVLVLNGSHSVRNETAAIYLVAHFAVIGWETLQISSIDSTRNLLAGEGIPVHLKTDPEPELLATVGEALERYNGFGSAQVRTEVRSFMAMNRDENCVAIVHMSAPGAIANLQEDLRPDGVHLRTVWITQDRTHSSGAAEMARHDFRISNGASYADLASACVNLVETELKELERG